MAVSLSSVSRSSASGGKASARALRLRRRRAFEQRRVVALHVAQMAEQRLGEGVAVGKAEKAREPLEPLAVARQRVGLLVGHHLQPVLDRAQEPIGRAELVARVAVDPAALGQRRRASPASRARAAPDGGRRR